MLIEGEPGIGKSALLAVVVDQAVERGWTVLSAQGVRGRSGVGFSALHQLLRPVLDRARGLPNRQRQALETVFGTFDGVAPEPLILQIAVLSLVEEAAASQPVLLAVEDLHWLDRSSAEVVQFLAPRLGGTRALLLATARIVENEHPREVFDSRIALGPLSAEDSLALVSEHRPESTPAQRERIVRESVGNPLALTEFSASQVPSLSARPALHMPMTQRLEQAFYSDVLALSERTRSALVIAATGEDADAHELVAALRGAGLSPKDLTAAEHAGLGRLENGFRFRHPLVSSAVYDAADSETRRAAHSTLAAVVRDRGRAAQHLAAATIGWDDDVAARLAELARSADERGARTESSAAWEAAAALTEAPGARAERLAAAAEAARQAGVVDRSLDLVRRARPDASDEATILHLETTEWMLSQTVVIPDARSADSLVDVAITMTDPGSRVELLVFAAVRWYILQGSATVADRIAEELARAEGQNEALREIGLVLVQPATRLDVDRVLESFSGPLRPVDGILLNCLAFAAEEAGDLDGAERVWTAAENAYHAAGRTGDEATALCGRASVRLLRGDITGGMTDAALALHLSDQMGLGVVGAMAAAVLARARALRGEHELHLQALSDAVLRGGPRQFARVEATLAWAKGIAAANDGDDALAVTELEKTAVNAPIALWAGADLAEPAMRSGRTQAVTAWIDSAQPQADRTSSDHLRMLLLRSQALLTDGPGAQELFERAVARGEAAEAAVELARTRLHFGEWLRRRRKILPAREQLRASLPVFRAQGLDPLERRATMELRAAGASGASGATAEGNNAAAVLTAQELQICGLAATGMTNKAIADQVYLSHRTVGAHLHRAFAKLGISRRTQLVKVLGS
ncbi:LuxR family transcriptional regulator [Isoptericola chiayiensis]|uniref:LuxR family transcriptional regulator n=1 Tax=Isoptericola chiayiensis TaxID=579446 RepID=A0ABP8YHF6_9MICO